MKKWIYCQFFFNNSFLFFFSDLKKVTNYFFLSFVKKLIWKKDLKKNFLKKVFFPFFWIKKLSILFQKVWKKLKNEEIPKKKNWKLRKKFWFGKKFTKNYFWIFTISNFISDSVKKKVQKLKKKVFFNFFKKKFQLTSSRLHGRFNGILNTVNIRRTANIHFGKLQFWHVHNLEWLLFELVLRLYRPFERFEQFIAVMTFFDVVDDRELAPIVLFHEGQEGFKDLSGWRHGSGERTVVVAAKRCTHF